MPLLHFGKTEGLSSPWKGAPLALPRPGCATAIAGSGTAALQKAQIPQLEGLGPTELPSKTHTGGKR